MKRNLIYFVGAVALSTLAAWWRWPDSAHVIGTLRRGGAAPRHGVVLEPGPAAYRLVATAAVIPPWRGDARVSLEGDAAFEWSLALDEPVVDLGLHDFPRLDGDVIRGLAPRERIALWLTLRPRAGVDPVCGMPCGAEAPVEDGRCFCSAACRDAHRAGGPRTSASLAFRDAATGAPLLTVPVGYGAGGGAGHAHH